MKKVIIINGSPREGGNSDAIAELAAKELKARGVQAEVFRIREHEIKNCIGCDTCKTTDKCAHEDDVPELVKKATEYDGVLFVSPIYFGAAPGPFKTLVDRFYVLFNPNKAPTKPCEKRKCGVVLTYGNMPDAEAEKAARLFGLCGSVAGLGSSMTVLCGRAREKEAFANNPANQEKVKELTDWIVE